MKSRHSDVVFVVANRMRLVITSKLARCGRERQIRRVDLGKEEARSSSYYEKLVARAAAKSPRFAGCQRRQFFSTKNLYPSSLFFARSRLSLLGSLKFRSYFCRYERARVVGANGGPRVALRALPSNLGRRLRVLRKEGIRYDHSSRRSCSKKLEGVGDFSRSPLFLGVIRFR